MLAEKYLNQARDYGSAHACHGMEAFYYYDEYNTHYGKTGTGKCVITRPGGMFGGFLEDKRCYDDYGFVTQHTGTKTRVLTRKPNKQKALQYRQKALDLWLKDCRNGNNDACEKHGKLKNGSNLGNGGKKIIR